MGIYEILTPQLAIYWGLPRKGQQQNKSLQTTNPVPTSTYTLLINQHCIDRKHVAWNYNILPGFHNPWYVRVKK
jgi:hypothetical protein